MNLTTLRCFRYLLYLGPIIAIAGGYGLLALATQEASPFTVVTGTSMQPTILPGSVALIDKVPFSQLKKGDIIVFSPQEAKLLPCDATPSSNLIEESSVPCFYS
jgi:signal peptidase I